MDFMGSVKDYDPVNVGSQSSLSDRGVNSNSNLFMQSLTKYIKNTY